MSITTCQACRTLFETTEDQANSAGRVCTCCHHLGHRFDEFGNRVAFPAAPSTAMISLDNISEIYKTRATEVRSGRVSERLPNVAKALKEVHIAAVRVDYGNGSVCEPRFYTAEWVWATPRVSAAVQNEVLSFFRGLIDRRFLTWTDGLGGFGEIEWNIASDNLRHWHARNLYEYDGAVWLLEGL